MVEIVEVEYELIVGIFLLNIVAETRIMREAVEGEDELDIGFF